MPIPLVKGCQPCADSGLNNGPDTPSIDGAVIAGGIILGGLFISLLTVRFTRMCCRPPAPPHSHPTPTHGWYHRFRVALWSMVCSEPRGVTESDHSPRSGHPTRGSAPVGGWIAPSAGVRRAPRAYVSPPPPYDSEFLPLYNMLIVPHLSPALGNELAQGVSRHAYPPRYRPTLEGHLPSPSDTLAPAWMEYRATTPVEARHISVPDSPRLRMDGGGT
ncbi:hypothetical protein C8Q77DRAFT_1075752 [Trametes polyzona]|nr:hypothetical protein C8Q77DRAFT_1075752 [Trametes polyzona]